MKNSLMICMILFPNRDEVIKKEKKYFKLVQEASKITIKWV